MAWRIEFATDAEHDLELIFDHLVESYVGFGDSVAEALSRALQRVEEMRRNAERLGIAPHRGTLHDDMLPGLRHVTINRAIYWFDVLEAKRTVRVLGVFFGGQDHVRHMLERLLSR